MEERVVAPHLHSYRHAIMRRQSWRVDQDDTPLESSIEICETRRGEPLCSCGRMLLVWAQPLNSLDNRVDA